MALVDFPTGNQITFGQARDLARFYLCTPSMVMVGEVEEELRFSQNLEAFDFVGRQVAGGFARLGAQPGQVVAMVLPNR